MDWTAVMVANEEWLRDPALLSSIRAEMTTTLAGTALGEIAHMPVSDYEAEHLIRLAPPSLTHKETLVKILLVSLNIPKPGLTVMGWLEWAYQMRELVRLAKLPLPK